MITNMCVSQGHFDLVFKISIMYDQDTRESLYTLDYVIEEVIIMSFFSWVYN